MLAIGRSRPYDQLSPLALSRRHRERWYLLAPIVMLDDFAAMFLNRAQQRCWSNMECRYTTSRQSTSDMGINRSMQTTQTMRATLIVKGGVHPVITPQRHANIHGSMHPLAHTWQVHATRHMDCFGAKIRSTFLSE
jgi:hypothetical protein